MSTRFGIRVEEDNLDLIQYLNGGVRPLIEDETTFFIFEMNSDNTDTQNPDIKSENDLYNSTGHLKDPINFLF